MPNFTPPEAMQTARELDRDARSILLYAETVVVDHSGLLEGQRMNAADLENLRQMQAMGWLGWGRIPASLLGASGGRSKPTHWCRFYPAAWQVAAACRMIRAEQVSTYAQQVFAEVDERAGR